MKDILIREVTENDLHDILSLARRVVEIHVLPGLSSEGKQTLRQSLDDNIRDIIDRNIYASLKATMNDKLIAYIAWRNGNHIAQLYVDSDYHGKGLGSILINEILNHTSESIIKVRSSINAVGFYQQCGFKITDKESELNGIRFVPMEYTNGPRP